MPIYPFDRFDVNGRVLETIERIMPFCDRTDTIALDGVRYYRREICCTARMGDQWRKMVGTP